MMMRKREWRAVRAQLNSPEPKRILARPGLVLPNGERAKGGEDITESFMGKPTVILRSLLKFKKVEMVGAGAKRRPEAEPEITKPEVSPEAEAEPEITKEDAAEVPPPADEEPPKTRYRRRRSE